MRHELWPLVSGLLVLIGLLVSSGLLLVVGSLVALVWLAARVWERYGFRKVTYNRELSRRRAFIGDTIDYTVALNNDKPLPLIWVESQDPFPEGLELAGGGGSRCDPGNQPPPQYHNLSPALPAGHLEVCHAL